MKLKKSLGQNFFNNPRLAEKITAIVLEDNPQKIIEIGPGDGYFTNLLSKNNSVIAVEKDTELANNLKQKFPDVEILNQDILDLDFSSLNFNSNETVCYGSLPYNVSKKIIAKLITETKIPVFTFIIQKEVADKYIRTDSDTSLLSVITKLYVDSKVILDIKPGSFIPAPKVMSSLIQFRRNDNLSEINNEEMFIKLVKEAFRAPRKMLRNNLKGMDIRQKELLNMRPSDLSFTQYASIANSL